MTVMNCPLYGTSHRAPFPPFEIAPAWREVRAAAIRDAIAKGRDYAAALGGGLRAVEHIADPGFLAGDGQRWASTGFIIADGITLTSDKHMQN
ncbi:MAG TPA: hypothetical protein VF506_06190 [Streptosporangiaceae bacterium]